MNLGLIPLLLASLLMISVQHPGAESAELILSGGHQVEDHRGALVVGDANVIVPTDAMAAGPIYVIGGELVVEGGVLTDVVQLAGTVTIQPGANVGGELQHVAGTQIVSDAAHVGRRTTVDVTPGEGDAAAGYVSFALVTLLLAAAGSRLSARRGWMLDNVAGAAAGHPAVALVVGILLTLVGISVVVFMAFTLILIPVAIVGLLAGVLAVAYGVIGWGRLVGRRLPIGREGWATGLGIVLVSIGLRIAALLPLVGDLAVAGILVTGVGAVILTYFGITRFRPVVLPDDGVEPGG